MSSTCKRRFSLLAVSIISSHTLGLAVLTSCATSLIQHSRNSPVIIYVLVNLLPSTCSEIGSGGTAFFHNSSYPVTNPSNKDWKGSCLPLSEKLGRSESESGNKFSTCTHELSVKGSGFPIIILLVVTPLYHNTVILSCSVILFSLSCFNRSFWTSSVS